MRFVLLGAAALAAVAPYPPYDPLGAARAAIGKVENLEASVPPMCYTKTDGVSNPCWTCHTGVHGTNRKGDYLLQESYAFSEFALTLRWSNLLMDRSAAIRGISDEDILSWIRADNLAPLREALAAQPGYPGYVPDLDLGRGFDDDGFARDGSGWRALRYKPFPGTFWPTNGASDDVFIRLPPRYGKDAAGTASRATLRANYAILEAIIAGDPDAPPATLRREVEPVDETAAGFDLDGNGRLGTATAVNGVPARWAGAAARDPVRRGIYPGGTEFLHTVRYVDPDHPQLLSRRLKELRYMKKTETPDTWAILRAYEREYDEKQEGRLPVYRGDPFVGLLNAFGWQLQGFIEDGAGRLRLQTEEEHRFCMGCHSGIGATVDSTFALARKVPGRAGWRHQDLRGIADVPQLGQKDGEILTYLRRVGGGDEYRANAEIRRRYFPGGRLDEASVSRDGRDIARLLTPSRRRALDLDKAYLLVVREQSFSKGRDAVLAPARVHAVIENGTTGLAEKKRVYADGRLRLSW